MPNNSLKLLFGILFVYLYPVYKLITQNCKLKKGPFLDLTGWRRLC